uniref:TraG-D_C domain-containing protein n=2 Tax=Steinernema glaseri TaxID=37863 RepID=A0A1I7ZA90_9BILA
MQPCQPSCGWPTCTSAPTNGFKWIDGLELGVTAYSTLPAVMRLADMYQCTYVISRCEQFLRSDESKHMPPMTKFAIADEFNLADDVRDEIVKKIPTEQLKRVVRSGRHRVFSVYSRDIIERQLASDSNGKTVRESIYGN